MGFFWGGGGTVEGETFSTCFENERLRNSFYGVWVYNASLRERERVEGFVVLDFLEGWRYSNSIYIAEGNIN